MTSKHDVHDARMRRIDLRRAEADMLEREWRIELRQFFEREARMIARGDSQIRSID